MDYVTIFLSLGAALVGSIIGGVMTMLATLLANWLQWQSEKRKEKRQKNMSRVESMRNYLSRTIALAAQHPHLMEFEKDNPVEGKRVFMKLWFEDIYPLRTLFYEKPKLQKKLDDFDGIFFDVLLEKSELEKLQTMATDIYKDLDEMFDTA